MDKTLAKYLTKETNAVKLEVVISRAALPNGMEHIRVLHGEDLLYQFWEHPRKVQEEKPEPKHTGGRKPYIMLMAEELGKLQEEKVPNIEELVGFLVLLAGNIEWKTGRLVKKRSKRALQYEDLAAMYSRGKGALRRVLVDLRRLDLLAHTPEGYFISGRLIRKGAAKK